MQRALKYSWFGIEFTFLIASGKLTFTVTLSKEKNRNYSLAHEISTQYLTKTVFKRLQQPILFVSDLGTETRVFINHKVRLDIAVFNIYEGELNEEQKNRNTARGQHGLEDCTVYGRSSNMLKNDKAAPKLSPVN
jgi:hypothetical protein